MRLCLALTQLVEMLIVRALYGMKSSGSAWCQHLVLVLYGPDMEFKPCYADNDVWMKPGLTKEGTKFYHYICIYVDDILIISDDPKLYMEQMGEHFLIKRESIGQPTMYLGQDIKTWTNPITNEEHWRFRSNTYLKEALRVVNGLIKNSGVKVSGKGKQTFSSLTYRAEFDSSSFCNPEQVTVYQNLIGMLRWLVELGRLDILLETSLLSS